MISTEDGCDTSPPKENPKNWAVIYAIMYFHNFVNMLIRSVEAAQTSLNTLNGYLTAHFTSSNFKLAVCINSALDSWHGSTKKEKANMFQAETWKNTVASASTTATGAILSLAWVAFPELGILSVGASAASLGGASATFKTGIELSFLTKTVGVFVISPLKCFSQTTVLMHTQDRKPASGNCQHGQVAVGYIQSHEEWI